MQKSEKNTAEQYLVVDGKKKKWGVVKVFCTCWDVVSVLVKACALVDKWWPKIKELLDLDS